VFHIIEHTIESDPLQ